MKHDDGCKYAERLRELLIGVDNSADSLTDPTVRAEIRGRYEHLIGKDGLLPFLTKIMDLVNAGSKLRPSELFHALAMVEKLEPGLIETLHKQDVMFPYADEVPLEWIK